MGIEDAGAFSYFYNHASGTIRGGAGYGVVLEFGNVITNLGTISGYRDGVKAVYFAANVNNSGVVSASGVTFVTGGPGHGAGLAPGSYGTDGVLLAAGARCSTSPPARSAAARGSRLMARRPPTFVTMG